LEVEVSSGPPEVGARFEGRIGVVAPQPLRRLYGGRRITLGEVQLGQQNQGRVRPDRTTVLDDDALETGGSGCGVRRAPRGGYERPGVERVLGGEARQ